MTVFLETTRLRLRQFTEADAPRLFALDGDSEVMRYCGPRPGADVAAYLHRLRTVHFAYYAASPSFGFWAVEALGSADFLGWFHLRPALDYRFAAEAGYRAGDFDLGYRLIRTAWGKGFATEVSRVLIERAFAQPSVEAVVACALAANAASIRVMEKMGMKKARDCELPEFGPAVTYRVYRLHRVRSEE